MSAAMAPEEDAALCRSALWEALALGFRPPTDETLRRLLSPEGAGALADAAGMLDSVSLRAAVLALAAKPPPPLDELRLGYDRLFGHTARGRTTPYETEYGADSTWAPPREMSDLGAFLRAFGLVPRPDAHERLDHVAAECEFMLVLARKEAYALERCEPDMLAVTRKATRDFLRDHIGRWLPALGARLAREDTAGFYTALGQLAVAFVVAECGRVGVAAGPELLRLRSAEPDGAPMACGPAPVA
jgi:DMSO reductase family type II enzyme chaperone